MRLALSASVGTGGVNDRYDVLAVQKALVALAAALRDDRLDPGPIDGESGDSTEGAVAHFQRRCGVRRPDGRVDVAGLTERRLAAQLRIASYGLVFPAPAPSKWPYHGPGAGMRAYGARRSGGARAHAGVDLYHPVGTPVLAVADGEVVRAPSRFYAGTDALEVAHGHLVVRYGEIAPGSADHLGPGDRVLRGEQVAEVGRLVGISVPSAMLHVEFYDSTDGGALTRAAGTSAVDGFTGRPFLRRRDLFDPTGLLARAPLAR